MVATNYEGSAYLLDPTGDDASKFEYEKDLIVNTDGYVSSLATYDIDGDGWLEMFVPDMTHSNIEIFKMSAPVSDEFLQ